MPDPHDNVTDGEESSGAPVLCARHEGFDICLEGYDWELSRPDKMMEGLEDSRYADICGTDILAMAGVGWQFIADPVCFTAANQEKEVIASAWAAPMRTEDKHTGCNLTYAVDAKYEGRGLAKLLTAFAFLAADQMHPGMEFGNIECRTDNEGSIALATALGFMRYPEGDFSMPTVSAPKEIAFYGFRMEIDALRRSAHQVLEKKNMLAVLPLIQRTVPASQI
ncbi:GNAT family N-acetyltransferase [Janthinobacterium sp. 17J80-10]|uniref:GNAT family N-acetyltransferase n=1 Tax=Janthinobacterium sp. 17J80-10 TaxID=2497863 RepID=UPI0013E8CF27|nr:GNAT family N-acetyltransferase [Janthinobacterium sp. 17J80-10]